MVFPATFRGNFNPLSHFSNCCDLRFRPFLSSPIVSLQKRCRFSHLQVHQVSRLGSRGRSRVVCGVTETEKEPEYNNDDEKAHDDGGMPPSADSTVQNDPQIDYQPLVVDKDKDQSVHNVMLNGDDMVNNDNQETEAQGDAQDSENLVVASGSPLPGVKPQVLDESIRIPKETIDILKDQVFGFDTFFVTNQEPYEGGVLFKGNLRGKAAKSYEKITKRMQDKFGDTYKLFLLINPEDDKPVAVVVPRNTLQPETTGSYISLTLETSSTILCLKDPPIVGGCGSNITTDESKHYKLENNWFGIIYAAVPEWFAAGAFGLVTVFTLLLRNVPELQSNLLSAFDNLILLKDGLPGALVTALVLGTHEIGHILVARSIGIKLGVPYFVPSWQIGSFGAITRILNIVPNREDLLKVAAAGPIAGFSLGLVLLLLGFLLPPSDGIGIVVDASVFHESLLAGGIAKLLLGDVLKEGTPISVNPLLLWAWAGLLINAINSIPAGEVDGGRISFAIWGRKASARLTAASIALLGFSSLFNDVAFYWVVLIFFLQRGPIAPLSEEISDPDDKFVALGVLVLLLGLLVCLPYPFPFANDTVSF